MENVLYIYIYIYIYINTPDERKLWKKPFFCSLHALALLIKMYIQFQ